MFVLAVLEEQTNMIRLLVWVFAVSEGVGVSEEQSVGPQRLCGRTILVVGLLLYGRLLLLDTAGGREDRTGRPRFLLAK